MTLKRWRRDGLAAAPRSRARLAAAGDLAIGVCLIAWLLSELVGGQRIRLLGVALSNRDTVRSFWVFTGVCVLRHVLVPAPSTFARIKRLLGYVAAVPRDPPPARRRVPDWLFIAAIVLITRLSVLAIGVAASASATPTGDRARDTMIAQGNADPLKRFQGVWDSGWYAEIAVSGYRWDPSKPNVQQNVAFFPAWPLTLQAGLFVFDGAARLIGLPPNALGADRPHHAVAVGGLTSILVFAIALTFLLRLAQLDFDVTIARRVVILAAVYPFGYFFSASYTEALFLAAVTGTFLMQRTRRFGWMIVLGLLAGLTRQTGFIVTIPLGVAALFGRKDAGGSPDSLSAWELAGVLAPAVGAGIYCIYLWTRFGDPFAWVHAQAAWPPAHHWQHLTGLRPLSVYLSSYPFESINVAAALIALPWIWRSRVVQPAYAVLGVLMLAIPFARDVVPLARMTAPVFPIFMGMASVIRGRVSFAVVAVVCLVLQLAAAYEFYAWRPLY